MFPSTKVMSALVLLSIALSCTLAADPGFYTTDPTMGQIQFLSFASMEPELAYDTHLSFPTALAINQNLDIYFANSAPATLPWISHTRVETKNSLIFSTLESNTYGGSLIDEVAVDEQLFYLVSKLPTAEEFADYPLIATVQSVGDAGESSTLLSYSTPGYGYFHPTSIALDYDSNTLYFTSIHVDRNTSETISEIYRMDYAGGGLTNIWRSIFETPSSEHPYSLQYSNGSLFYVDTYPKREIKRFNLETNATSELFTSINTEQIYIPQNSWTIWVLDDAGIVYSCPNLNCAEITPQFTIPNLPVQDFAVNEQTSTVYYISKGSPAVQWVSSNTGGAVSIGIGINSQIWADTVRGRLYYATANLVDSVSTQGLNWHYVNSFPDNIQILSGDVVSGNLIVTYENQDGLYSYSSVGGITTLYNKQVTAVTIFNRNRILFFASETDSAIFQCVLPECRSASTVVENVNQVTSLTVGTNGNTLYYATPNATMSVPFAGGNPTLVLRSSNNIKPFAVATWASNILFIDSPEVGGLSLKNCSYPSCVNPTVLGTTSGLPIVIHPIPAGGNAWIAVDTSGTGTIYWSGSNLQGYVGKTTLNPRQTTWIFTGDSVISGLAWNVNASALYVSKPDGIMMIFDDDTGNATCSVSVAGNTHALVGAVGVTQDSLVWAELRSGEVYQCPDTCSESLLCDAVSVDETDYRYSCPKLQFITTDENGDFYNQNNCGGITKVSDGVPTVIKPSDGFPISSLTIAPDAKLVYSLPYRASIASATETGSGLEDIQTYYSATGDFTNLFVDDSETLALYWINKAGASLMSWTGEVITDYNPVSVGSFLYVKTGLVTVTVTLSFTPTPSVTASASPATGSEPTLSASTSMSASATASATATASASASVSESPSATASPTPSGSISVSESVWPSGVSESPSVSPTTTATPTMELPSDSVTVSPSTVFTTTRSPTPSISDSNSPGIAYMGEEQDSPIITKTGWEWIGFLSIVFVLFCLIPISCWCWRKSTAAEMALSLRLPDGDEI